MSLSATEIVLLNAIGGGLLDWGYLDRLVEELDSAGYDLSIMDDDSFFQEPGLSFNAIVYAIFQDVAYEFGAKLADYLELEEGDDFILSVIDTISDSIYADYMCSSIVAPFEDPVMSRDVEEFVKQFVVKDESGNFSLNVDA